MAYFSRDGGGYASKTAHKAIHGATHKTFRGAGITGASAFVVLGSVSLFFVGLGNVGKESYQFFGKEEAEELVDESLVREGSLAKELSKTLPQDFLEGVVVKTTATNLVEEGAFSHAVGTKGEQEDLLYGEISGLLPVNLGSLPSLE